MGYPIKQSQTDQPLEFLLVSSTDHITGKTSVSPTVTLSKNGSAFASPAGAVSEIGSGWYKVAGNTTDSNTLGPLLLHATATGADPCDDVFPVVAYNPLTAAIGLAGAGSVAWVVTVETSGGDPISGAEVWCTLDAAGDNITAGTLTTDDNGQVTFMLDSGVTYYLWRDHSNYQWDNPVTFTVS